MKYALLAGMLSFTVTAAAQFRPVVAADSVTKNTVINNTVRNQNRKQKNISPITLKVEIENELIKIVSAYYAQPNTQSTWVKIRAAAENALYSYFKNGKLLGNKPIEAYYVKIGNETMTTADIANHKIILVAGVATFKPAEFEIIRVEITSAQ